MKKLLFILFLIPLSAYGAIDSQTQWEIRTTGSATGGANYYNAGGASADYSQQDAPQLTVTDIVTDGTTTITSATGGFTAAMVGNGIYLVGTALLWYQITAYTNTNTVTVDTAIAADTGITGNVGGASSYVDDAIWSAGVPGNLYWVKAGNYATTALVSDNQIFWSIIGYNTTRGDNPTGTDRPLIDCGANSFQLVVQDHLCANMRFTSSNGSYTYYVQGNSRIYNSDLINTSTGSALEGWTSTFVIDSYLASTSGKGFNANNGGTLVVNSYIKGGTYSIYNNHTIAPTVIGSILDGVSFGIWIKDDGFCPAIMIDNTIFGDGSGIGIDLGDQAGTYLTPFIIKNNDIQGWLTGVSADADYGARVALNWNNFYANTADVSNVTKGANTTALDSQFVASATGDFEIGNALFNNAGLAPYFGGLSTSYTNQGAVKIQQPVPASTPTFGAITKLLREDTGLTAYWSAGGGTITSYNVYGKADNDTGLFTTTNLLAKLPNTATKFFIDNLNDGTFLIGTTTYYVGVRAENDGSEDANTTSLFSSPVTRWIPQRVSNGINLN